jgi:hypothetical protein
MARHVRGQSRNYSVGIIPGVDGRIIRDVPKSIVVDYDQHSPRDIATQRHLKAIPVNGTVIDY